MNRTGAAAGNLVPITVTKKSEKTGRYIFECNGRTVYEWDQSLEEVNLYITAPPVPNFKASMLDIRIETKRICVGLKSHNRFFIEEETFSKVDTTESSWYVDDNEIHIILIKAFRGEVWDSALMMNMVKDRAAEDMEESGGGRSRVQLVDPLTREAIKRELMLERFQEENPGFDFRSAEFNGEVPDPQTFMDGIKYRK